MTQLIDQLFHALLTVSFCFFTATGFVASRDPSYPLAEHLIGVVQEQIREIKLGVARLEMELK